MKNIIRSRRVSERYDTTKLLEFYLIMKHFTKPTLTVFASLVLGINAFAQSTGNLSFTFTQQPHTSYSGTKNVMAVWIQDANGNFVKTRTRNVGTGTKDHLPTWAVNSGGTSGNALGSGCNVVGATTGATYTNFSTRTVTWDGTDVNGNVVADGAYKITIQSTWNHGGGGSTTKSYTFTKGASSDNQTPADDANFTSVSLDWTPSALGIENISNDSDLKVYPNPSDNGVFNVEYSNGSEISVVDLQGNIVLQKTLENMTDTIQIDLTDQPNGNYIIHLSHNSGSTDIPVTILK